MTFLKQALLRLQVNMRSSQALGTRETLNLFLVTNCGLEMFSGVC